MAEDKTIKFFIGNENGVYVKQTIISIYNALREKGYNPIDQIAGYILSEDPTYITTYQNARNKIQKIDRDELLRLIIKYYIEN